MLVPLLLSLTLPYVPPPPPPPRPADRGQYPAVIKSDLIYNVKVSGNKEAPKMVALTFDDGPSPTYTPMVLEIAKQEGVPLTFFVIGQEAIKHPEIVQAAANAGHEIQNHTWRHPLYDVGDTRGAWEVKQTNAYLESVTGKAPTLFRPPGGRINTGTAAVAKAIGMKLVFWDSTGSVSPYASTEMVSAEVLRDVKPGSIILLHDGGGNRLANVKALPIIIHRLRAKGYTFVTVSRLLKERAEMPLTAQGQTPKAQTSTRPKATDAPADKLATP